VWTKSREIHYQRSYIQVMTVPELNLMVYALSVKDFAVQIINVWGFLFTLSVVAQPIVSSEPIAISGDVSLP
jgi:hypothetical protein